MVSRYLEMIHDMYETMDSILITNKEGIIEYCTLMDAGFNSIRNEDYMGKPILEVYPELTRETSTHFEVMRTGKPILDKVQTVTDRDGRTLTFLSNTYPIIHNGEVLGGIEGTLVLDKSGSPVMKSKRINRQGENGEKLFGLEDIITENPEMKKTKEKVELVAEGESPVMVIGDTGTGKEMIAQSVHTHSLRRNGPFISLNCSAIPANLLESTLFGTVKGSYTGAENRKGLFELADRGTLFLDELNSMDISLQGKILKAIEEQRVRRVGGEREIGIDIRMVSAMNEDPYEVIERGQLRRDLFYRLGVVQINLPLLKDRPEDIMLLANFFVDRYRKATGRKVAGISAIVETIFLNYDWPGNVRELKNAIEYAFNVMKDDVLTLHDVPEHILYEKKQIREAKSGADHRQAADNSKTAGGGAAWRRELSDGRTINQVVEDFERKILESTLTEAGNITDAARELHISRQALQYKMTKYGLSK